MVRIQGTAPGRDKRSPQSRATGKRAVVASQLDGTGVLNLTDHNNTNPFGSSLLNCIVAFNPIKFFDKASEVLFVAAQFWVFTEAQ